MIRAVRKDWREDARLDNWEAVIFEERVEYEDAVAVCLARPDIPAPFLIMECVVWWRGDSVTDNR